MAFIRVLVSLDGFDTERRSLFQLQETIVGRRRRRREVPEGIPPVLILILTLM